MAVNGSTPTPPTRQMDVPSAMHTMPRHENRSLPFRLYVCFKSSHFAMARRSSRIRFPPLPEADAKAGAIESRIGPGARKLLLGPPLRSC